LVVISAFVLIASSKALFILAMASSMLEFDDVVDVTEPVEWDIVYLSLCLFYVEDRAVGECPPAGK
jgi:hypothetical protein